MSTFEISPRFQSLIRPLKAEEQHQLESNLLNEGCRDALVVWKGILIDGHNRYAICTKHKLPFAVVRMEFPNEQYAELWIRFNQLGRRNLTDDQRAMMADAAAELQGQLEMKARAAKGTPAREARKSGTLEGVLTSKVEPKERTRAEVAKKAGVGERKMRRARIVRKADPALARQVEMGDLALVAACRQIARSEAVKVRPVMPDSKYRVLYADPPWQYGDTRNGLEGTTGAEAHYPTMSIAELCALPVKDRCEPDAVLFLWVTSPFLAECFAVIKAWGFTYKASFVWDKLKHNLGHYNSVRHEFLLVCTRGSCVPDNPKLYDSVQSVERTRHSEKPAAFRTIIETLYRHGKRLDLFPRSQVEGWDSYGNHFCATTSLV